MSMTIYNYNVTTPIPLPVNKNPAGNTAPEVPENKPSEAAGATAGEEMLSTGTSPINYYYGNNQIFELLRSFIDQKFRIIEEIRNAMRPNREELEEEEKLAEEEEVEEIEELAQAVQDEVEAILLELDSLMALMSTPTADMSARISMVTAQLRAIVSKLSKLGLEVGRAIATLKQQDTTGAAQGTIENLVNNLVRLDEAISDIQDNCQAAVDQFTAA